MDIKGALNRIVNQLDLTTEEMQAVMRQIMTGQCTDVYKRQGMDGRGLAPGKIIAVADPVKSGKQIGGRLSAVDGRALTLDRDVEARPGDRLLVNLPNGKAEARSVQSVVGLSLIHIYR